MQSALVAYNALARILSFRFHLRAIENTIIFLYNIFVLSGNCDVFISMQKVLDCIDDFCSDFLCLDHCPRVISHFKLLCTNILSSHIRT